MFEIPLVEKKTRVGDQKEAHPTHLKKKTYKNSLFYHYFVFIICINEYRNISLYDHSYPILKGNFGAEMFALLPNSMYHVFTA